MYVYNLTLLCTVLRFVDVYGSPMNVSWLLNYFYLVMLVHCFYSFLSFYLSASHCCFHACISAFWLPISNKLELS